MQSSSTFGLKAGATLALLGGVAALAAPAQAQVNQIAIFQTQYYSQTGPTTTTPINYTFDTRIFSVNSGDVGTATVSNTSGTIGTLVNTGLTPGQGYTFEYNTGYLPPQTDLTTANPSFPFDTYTVNYSGGSAGTGSVSTDFTQVAYPASVPTLAANTFSGLQGLQANNPFTLSFNTFQPGPNLNVNDSLIFFQIFDVSTSQVVFSSQGGLPDTTTSILIPANTLLPNTKYETDLDFSNRIQGIEAPPNDGIFFDRGFDQRSTAFFTTAVPESSSFALLVLGALPLGLLAVKRRRAA